MCTPSSPFKGGHLLLGNGSFGNKAAVDPMVTDIPLGDQTHCPSKQEILDLYLSFPIIRALTRKVNLFNWHSDVNTADTIIGLSSSNEIFQSLYPLDSLKQENV